MAGFTKPILYQYFDMVGAKTDAFPILFLRSHEAVSVDLLHNLEQTLISFIVPYINISNSDEHRRQLAAGVVGIAEGAAVTRW